MNKIITILGDGNIRISEDTNNSDPKDISLLDYLPTYIKDDSGSVINNIVSYLDKFEKSLNTNYPFNTQEVRDTYLNYNNNPTISILKEIYNIEDTSSYLIPNLLQSRGNKDSFKLLLKIFGIESEYIGHYDDGTLSPCQFYLSIPASYISEKNLKELESKLSILVTNYFNVCNTFLGIKSRINAISVINNCNTIIFRERLNISGGIYYNQSYNQSIGVNSALLLRNKHIIGSIN